MSCSTAKVNLCIGQGETFRKSFVWKTGEPATAVDLTDWQARMQVRESIDAEEVLISLDSEPEANPEGLAGTISLTHEGEVQLYIDHETTAKLDFESAVYDLELISPSDDVRRLVAGKVTLSREVTR